MSPASATYIIPTQSLTHTIFHLNVSLFQTEREREREGREREEGERKEGERERESESERERERERENNDGDKSMREINRQLHSPLKTH